MKILQILPELNVGGVETGTVDLAGYLARQGHQSIVVSGGGELVARLEASGTKHYTLPVHKKSLWTVLPSIKALRKIILEENVDVVHARSRVPAWIAYFACRKTKAALVTTCHGYYGSRMFSQVMGWPKLVIVPSEVIGRHMIEHFRVSPGGIRYIPRSVDLERFNVARAGATGKSFFTVVIVGRLTPLKGHTFFLRSMAKVIRAMPNIRVWIIGDAPAGKQAYKEELRILIKRLGIQEQVEFLGNRRDVPQLLAQADVLVLSTVTQEAFGRVILEAQAAGVPVVATQVGGVVDIIEDGRTGLLVPAKDIDAMAKAVMRVLNDKKTAAQMVLAAREKLEKEFTLEQMASRTVRVYEELVRSINILVIKISSMGDVVLVTAALKALRAQYPHAKIYCLVGKDSRKVLQNCPCLEGIIVDDPKHKYKGWWRTFLLSHKLRKYRFDKIVDFQNNRRSHLLAFLSFPRESYGYDNGKWGNLLTHPLKTRPGGRDDIPAVEHQFQLLKGMGIAMPPDAALELWPSAKDRQSVQELLESEWLGNNPRMVGINIAASEKWQTKNWPVEYIARLCDLLAARGIRVLVTGMEKDKPLVQRLLDNTKSKPAVFVGRTDILQLAALIDRCRVYITPDSAPLHVAAAMKTPLVAFFGPTDSRRHRPPARHEVILEKKLACAPCYSPRCLIMTHACMREITPEEVLRKVEELLDVKK
ncbi:MAG: GT4 family glycosyltransferase PelF [Candidatus Omnitrophica bacterium]|nr:GT4 family glycosyltransferase PelF [Candidatus Omnitrophota bacterium]